ncbi:MAG: hypothetical protein ACN4GR_02960 [Arenicellales bacterium]
MKAINKKVALVGLVSCLLGTTQLALAEKKDLNKDEIIATFSGKTAWGNHAIKGKRNMVDFAPDGTYISKHLDEKSSGEGKWSVDGSNLCIEKEADTRRHGALRKRKTARSESIKERNMSGPIPSSRMETRFNEMMLGRTLFSLSYSYFI